MEIKPAESATAYYARFGSAEQVQLHHYESRPPRFSFEVRDFETLAPPFGRGPGPGPDN